jgi:hypothetical protein
VLFYFFLSPFLAFFFLITFFFFLFTFFFFLFSLSFLFFFLFVFLFVAFVDAYYRQDFLYVYNTDCNGNPVMDSTYLSFNVSNIAQPFTTNILVLENSRNTTIDYYGKKLYVIFIYLYLLMLFIYLVFIYLFIYLFCTNLYIYSFIHSFIYLFIAFFTQSWKSF